MRVIYNPQLDETPGIRPLGYQAPIVRKSSKKGSDLELTTIWLIPGVNELTDEEWKFISGHVDTAEKIRRGAIRPINTTLKEGQVATGTLADYSLNDAREIIYNCFDTEWLERIKVVDTRNEIFRWTQDRIKNVEKMQQGSAQGSVPSKY